MLWDEYVEETQYLPDLCVKFLNNTCPNDHKTCRNVHSKYPFLWQCEFMRQWMNFPEVHSKELESAFRIVQYDGVRLSSIDAQMGKVLFDPNSEWKADFDRMCIQKEMERMNIRRLSTVSSVLVNDSMATSYEWYFRDDKNKWIQYGTSTGNDNQESATTTSSNDLEKYLSVNKINKLDIQNAENIYSIDFDKMTQTNKQTGIVRAIRRRVAMGPMTAGSGPDFLCSPNLIPKAYIPKNAAQTNWAQSGTALQVSTQHVAIQQAASPQTVIQQAATQQAIMQQAATPQEAMQQVATHQAVVQQAETLQPVTQQSAAPQVTQQGEIQQDSTPQDAAPLAAIQIATQQAAATQVATQQDAAPQVPTQAAAPQVAAQVATHQTAAPQVAAQQAAASQVATQQAAVPQVAAQQAASTDGLYEWQFMGQHGIWVAFGSTSQGNGTEFATTNSSDDIERQFLQDPTSSMIISSNKYRYLIDFSTMTQTNINTSVQRSIRRIPNQSIPPRPSQGVLNAAKKVINFFVPNTTSMPPTATQQLSTQQVTVQQAVTPQAVAIHQPQAAPATGLFEWQFMGQHGIWITYGNTNQGNGTEFVTTNTSDDIEKQFSQNPTNPMIISSNTNRYLIDFISMTQTNIGTAVQRPIQRIPKQVIPSTQLPSQGVLQDNSLDTNVTVPPQAAPPVAAQLQAIQQTVSTGYQHEWQFKGQHGIWIAYGGTSQGNGTEFVTTNSSDDIERQFLQNPTNSIIISSNKYQYLIDFGSMTQTNMNTSVQRSIRRVPKQAIPSTIPPEKMNISIGTNITVPQISAMQPRTPQATMQQAETQRSVAPPVAKKPAATQQPSSTNALHEWQFMGQHGIWISYGSTSQGNGTEFVTTNSSVDIERQFLNDPTSSMIISSNKFQYTIDFGSMTQTNVNTSVQRSIRRIPQQGIPATQRAVPGGLHAAKKGANFMATSLTSDVADPSTETFQDEEYEWYFKDEHDQWIKYGQSNTSGQVNLVSKTSSNDIEAHFNDAPTKCMTIESSKHKYLLDFVKMTQTNEQTRVERAICRKAKNSSNLQQNVSLDWNVSAIYEWFFKDENNTWIKYGENNKQVGGDHATSTTSDDIEKHFCQNPNVPLDLKSTKNSYTIDFTKMTQTNKTTNVVRQICRRAKILSVTGGMTPRSQPSESLPSNWLPQNSNSTVTTIPINSGDKEFTTHSTFIKKTLPNIKILKMFRIQNPYLWKAFANKKNHMRERNPGIKFREEQLFHGTDSSNVKAICEENVDWRLHGSSTGQAYGRGSYFSNKYGVIIIC